LDFQSIFGLIKAYLHFPLTGNSGIKIGLPKNTKTKKKQTNDYAYASRIALHRVNGPVCAFARQPKWKATQKNFMRTDSSGRGQRIIYVCVS